MDSDLPITEFERNGAGTTVPPLVRNRWQQNDLRGVIDVGQHRRGKFFDMQAEDGVDVQVLDAQRKDRRLLLMVRRNA